MLATTALAGWTGFASAQQQETLTLPTIDVQSANDNGTVGYLATRTSSATKTNTPLLDIPQSISIMTRQQINDIGALKLEDVVRYMPGVLWHQGENNRDQVVIRGQSSSADFFVNGMRDDAQIFRDLYSTQRVEVLKGPNALIFGRGNAGGVVNRVLKEADGVTRREATILGGSFNDKRVSTDVGGAVTNTFAARLDAVFEDTDSYRDFDTVKRYGISPTFTWAPDASTSVKLWYEYFQDRRVFDRGVPSQNGLPYFPAEVSTFFGNPELSFSPATTNAVMLKVDHAFDNGLTVVNQTRFQDTKRFYRNVYPNTTSPVSPAGLATIAAYQNTNDRQNIINQTDWTYKFNTGFAEHTFLFGTEFANQQTANARFTGFFPPGNTATITVPASNPVTFAPVVFTGLPGDARNTTNLNVAAAYVQDQVNSRFPDPAIPGFFILSGSTRAQGFETSLVGYIMDQWQVTAGYAYTDARITGDLSATVRAGNRVALVPYNQFSIWNRYDFNEMWGVGLGVISMSNFYATSDDTVLLPAYARVDGAVFFRLNKYLRGQLNVENIFGERYYPTADANNNITPGSPRAFRVSITGNL